MVYNRPMRAFVLIFLFGLSSCKGTRFYWETKYLLPDSHNHLAFMKKFNLTVNMSDWHPVFGKYCSSYKSHLAHLFVCLQTNEIRIVSSYPGILKGDNPISDNPDTLEKYLERVRNIPGYQEHMEIKKYFGEARGARLKSERLLTYGKGSLIIKEELSHAE